MFAIYTNCHLLAVPPVLNLILLLERFVCLHIGILSFAHLTVLLLLNLRPPLPGGKKHRSDPKPGDCPEIPVGIGWGR